MDFEPISFYEQPEKEAEMPQLTEEIANEHRRISNSLSSHPSPLELFVVRDRQLSRLYLIALDTKRVPELLGIIEKNYPDFRGPSETRLLPTYLSTPTETPTSTDNLMDRGYVRSDQPDKKRGAIKKAEKKPEGEADRILRLERERKEREVEDMRMMLEGLEREIEMYIEKDPGLIHRMDQALEGTRVNKTPVPSAFIQAFK